MDFLLDHECDLAVKTGHLFLGNMKVKLRKESTTNVIARIRLEDDVTLPPRTELSVTGKAEAMSKRIPTFYSCVELSPSMKRRARNHVLTGCAVVQTNATNIPVPVMNTGEDTQVLNKGTVIAIMKAAA